MDVIKNGVILFLESNQSYYHHVRCVKDISEAEFFEDEAEAADVKRQLEERTNQLVHLIPIVQSTKVVANGWNLHDLMKQMDTYFEKDPKEIEKDFMEKTGVPLIHKGVGYIQDLMFKRSEWQRVLLEMEEIEEELKGLHTTYRGHHAMVEFVNGLEEQAVLYVEEADGNAYSVTLSLSELLQLFHED